MQLKLFILPVKNLAAAEGTSGVGGEEGVRGRRGQLVLDILRRVSGFGGGRGVVAGQRADYKEVLKLAEFEVFSRLREWRKAAAEN